MRDPHCQPQAHQHMGQDEWRSHRGSMHSHMEQAVMPPKARSSIAPTSPHAKTLSARPTIPARASPRLEALGPRLCESCHNDRHRPSPGAADGACKGGGRSSLGALSERHTVEMRHPVALHPRQSAVGDQRWPPAMTSAPIGRHGVQDCVRLLHARRAPVPRTSTDA